MFFPNVPAVLGVPALPRIPPAITSQVLSSLDGATDGMTSVLASATFNPQLPVSGFVDQVSSAHGLVQQASALLDQYPSALFDRFSDPVDGIQSSLGDLVSQFNSDPSASVGDFSDDLNVVTSQLGLTSDSFAVGDASVNDVPSLDTDANIEQVTSTAFKPGVTWGIVQDGKSVIQGDNFVSLEFKQEWVIADYQIEKGGFESYDKVTLPFDARVSVSCGGSVPKREAFLSSIKAIAGNLQLYDVVTPEETLSDMNVAHVDYKRTNLNGVGVILVYIYLLEIRQSVESDFSSTPASPTAVKSPAAAATKSDGTLQAIPATVAQFKQLANPPDFQNIFN